MGVLYVDRDPYPTFQIVWHNPTNGWSRVIFSQEWRFYWKMKKCGPKWKYGENIGTEKFIFTITFYWINISKILLFNYMFSIFLTCIPSFITIRYYLLFNLESHLLCIILYTKNWNLNIWSMTWLLISYYFEILRAFRV